MGNVSPTPQQLLTEAIVFGSIAVILYIGRMVSRVIANGSIKRLFLDDYIMTFTFMIYTTLLILIQISSRYATNLMDPADYDQVLDDPQEVQDRIYGSKIVIGLEQCMLFSTWGVKTCLLILYNRMTQNLRSNLYVKILAGYTALGFVVIMVTYYAVYCRPFSQYWAMPVQNMQCATYQYYSITQAVFNISSDAAMLAIVIPLLVKSQVRMRKKVLLLGVMSLGAFTIAAAIMNKFFNFASPLTTTYQIWYIREASTAIYVANMMCWWPLLRKIFGLKAFQNSSKRYRRQDNQPNGISKSAESTACSSQARPSFSLQRVFHLNKPGYRKAVNETGTSRKNAPVRASMEAINKQSSIELMDETPSVETPHLGDWGDDKEQQQHYHHEKELELELEHLHLSAKAGEDIERNGRGSVIEVDNDTLEDSDYHADSIFSMYHDAESQPHDENSKVFP